MTTGNRVADGLDEHLNAEAEWEKMQNIISRLEEKIELIEEKKDELQEQWDDLDCDAQELRDQISELEA